MKNSKFRILHLSDLHFRAPGEGKELADSIARDSALFDAPVADEDRLPISTVVISGDYQEQRTGLRQGAKWETELTSLIQGLMETFNWTDTEKHRVLLIPGNHDCERGTELPDKDAVSETRKLLADLIDSAEDIPTIREIAERLEGKFTELHSKAFRPSWDQYNRYASSHFLNCSCVHAVPLLGSEGPGKAYAHIVDRRTDEGIFYILLNAYAEAKTWPDDGKAGRFQLTGAVGREVQLKPIDAKLRELGFYSSNGKPLHRTVLVVHHHLFPMRTVGEFDATPDAAKRNHDLERRDILVDLPDLADFMPKWRTLCVLHGHRHRPFFGILRVLGFSENVNKEICANDSDDAAFDKDFEMVACGIGQAWHDESREVEGSNESKLLRPSVQLVDICPDAQRFFDAKVVVTPFQRDRHNRWRRIDPKSPLQPYASELVLPNIQRELFRCECFAGDQISVGTPYPLLRGDGTEQYVECFVTPFNKALQEVGGLFKTCCLRRSCDPPCSEAIFQKLIAKVQQLNKSKAMFSMMPFQLAGVYGLAALLFDQKTVHEQAIKEFAEEQWKELLRTGADERGKRPHWLPSHLESANFKIAEIAREHFDSLPTGTRSFRVLDLGAGTGRTIFRIRQAFAGCRESIEYRGIDINPDLANEADKALQPSKHGPIRLVPFMEGDRLVHPGEMCDLVMRGNATSWLCEIDVIVASYCIHHVPNNYRLWRMILDGSIEHLLEPDLVFRPDTLLWEAIGEGIVFGDVPTDLRTKFMSYLVEVYKAPRMLPSSADVSSRKELADRLYDFIPNKQIELYQRLYEALNPGGTLIVADPNGFSATFNRTNIYNDWRMAIAHFAEWTLVVKWLSEIGFKRFRIFRQMRLKNLDVKEIELPSDWITKAIAGEQIDFASVFGPEKAYEGLEIEDQHLGYIIAATKPLDEEILSD
jgi:SAM-dependent methyltransferase